MLALDEFLPIMYDKHPNKQWSSYFHERNLQAFAVYPVVVTPERYTYEAGYVSDTESSNIVDFQQTNKSTSDKVDNADFHGSLHTTSKITKTEL